MSVLGAIVIILVLIGLSALLAISEAAILNARKAHLRERANAGDRAAIRLLAVVESPTSLFATIQVGGVLAGFFAAATAAYNLVGPVRDWLEGAPIGFIAHNAGVAALILVTVALALVSIVAGELLPRRLALSRSDAIAPRLVGPMLALEFLLRPLVRFSIWITNRVLRLFGAEETATLSHVTHAEILAMVETAADEGLVEEDEANLVEDALTFGDLFVRNVMIPRVDVHTIDGERTLRDAVDLFFKTGISRLPVVHETPDDVLGILHVKDAFRLTWSDPENAAKPVANFIRPAYFVPETKPIDQLLHEFRGRRTHVAVVVDEYGGMAGLVTLEDLLEELVGEIADEFDPGYEPYREIEPGVYEVDGRVALNDLADLLDLDRDALLSEDVESVGGLIADRLGRMPEEGDVAEDGPVRFEVRAMDGYRVALALVEIIPPEPDPSLETQLAGED